MSQGCFQNEGVITGTPLRPDRSTDRSSVPAAASVLERAGEATVFLSSHDLAEIESFASHVGYLEEGKLRFSEEMTSLAARFREVEITFEGESALPSPMPGSWLQAKAAGGVVRFVESQFDNEKTGAEIQRVFGQAKAVAFRAMSLRAIFLAMARKAEAAQGAACG